LFYENKRQEFEPVIKQLIAEAQSIAPESVQEYARAMRDREENIELLKTFSRPIMMIIGENDQSVPLEKSLEQSKLIQRPYILRLKETAHMGMYEKPTETFNFLHNFLNVC
jgi:pimeloyl-ACP methyl ester carboxylesterase